MGAYQCICQPCVPPMLVGGAAFGGLGKAGFAGLVLALLLLVSLLVYVLLFHRPVEWMPPRIPYAKLHLGRHPELLGHSRTGRVLKGRYRGSAVVSGMQSDLCMLLGSCSRGISGETCKAQRLAARQILLAASGTHVVCTAVVQVHCSGARLHWQPAACSQHKATAVSGLASNSRALSRGPLTGFWPAGSEAYASAS